MYITGTINGVNNVRLSSNIYMTKGQYLIKKIKLIDLPITNINILFSTTLSSYTVTFDYISVGELEYDEKKC